MNYSSPKKRLRDPNRSTQDYSMKNLVEDDWKSLNMRRPGGVGILDLQKISHKGYLVEPKIPEGYFDPHYIEEKFTEEEVQAFKEAFLFFDREANGVISLEDLGLALRSLGFLVTGNELRDLMDKYDPDGRDTINLKDFLSCIADISNKVDGPEIIKQCFAVFDKDETGLINIDEFRHVMSTLGDTMSNEEINAILKELDLYGDNVIRMDDLVDLLAMKK